MRQHSTPSAPAVNAGRQRTPARTVSPPFQPAPDLTEAPLSDFAVSRARRKTQLICPIRRRGSGLTFRVRMPEAAGRGGRSGAVRGVGELSRARRGRHDRRGAAGGLRRDLRAFAVGAADRRGRGFSAALRRISGRGAWDRRQGREPVERRGAGGGAGGAAGQGAGRGRRRAGRRARHRHGAGASRIWQEVRGEGTNSVLSLMRLLYDCCEVETSGHLAA